MDTNLTIMDDKDLEKIEKREARTMRELQEELKRITKLGSGLNDADKGFIKARRSYLTAEQKEMWADVLNEKPQKGAKKAKAPEGEDTGDTGNDTGEGDTGDQTNELSNLSYKELQARASTHGIKAVGVARPELEKLVAEAESSQA